MADASRLVNVAIPYPTAVVIAEEIDASTSAKPEIAALTPLAGGADLAATVTKVNAIIAALKA